MSFTAYDGGGCYCKMVGGLAVEGTGERLVGHRGSVGALHFLQFFASVMDIHYLVVCVECGPCAVGPS